MFASITIPAVAGGTSDLINLCGLFEKGYGYTRDAGAAFTAALQGSVTGNDNWTAIANLNASGSGAIPVHYNFVRVNVSVAGALGATTALTVAGKD
jgi:hypothetical protein